MANENFTQLPSVSTALSTDIIAAVQGGVTVQETLQQVLNLAMTFDTLFFAGDPNGNLGGQTYQRCWDTTNNVLWICTLTGSSTTAIWQTVFGTLTNGQIPIGFTGNAPQRATLTAGTNIAIVNGPGSITISASGTAAFLSFEITTTSATMTPNAFYVANNASLVTLTLPATAAFGDVIEVAGKGAGLFVIAQNAGQQIHMGSHATTVGVTGSVTAINQFDSFVIRCTTANTTWTLISSSQGSVTVA